MGWRALLLAPLAAPAGYAVAALCLMIWRVLRAGESFPPPGILAALLPGIFIAGAPIALTATLVAGLPALLLLRRAGRVTRAPVLAIAGVIGFATTFVLAPFLRGELFSIPLPWWLGILLGLASGETYWRLSHRAAGVGELPRA